MKLAYVAGPYRAATEWGVLSNIRDAESVAIELWKLGLAVICPHKNTDVAADVRAWAIENGDNPKLRIALCGYEGEHAMPESWECVAWKARGGYGSQSDGRGRDNAGRERIWFSPHCLRPGLFTMFDQEAEPTLNTPDQLSEVAL